LVHFVARLVEQGATSHPADDMSQRLQESQVRDNGSRVSLALRLAPFVHLLASPSMELQFKWRFVDPILAGTKTATLRRATILPDPEVGTEIVMRNGYRQNSTFATAELKSILHLRFPEDITDEVAVADGFPSAQVLIESVKALYPGVRFLDQYRWHRLKPHSGFNRPAIAGR